MRSVYASRTIICSSRRGFLWKKNEGAKVSSACEGQYSVRSLVVRSCAKLLRLKMAKRCQEEYEDVNEVLHPLTLSTLYYMYVPWPRLNVCLTCLR